MKIQHLETDTIPYILIDDTYDEDELEEIWKEFKFLTNARILDNGTEDTRGAWKRVNGERMNLKNSNAKYLESVYKNRRFSAILQHNRKLHKRKIYREHPHWLINEINTNYDVTQVSYYDEGNYYKTHSDCAVMTTLTWLWQEPKGFDGGELTLHNKDIDIEIPLVNNRSIIFPSCVRHSVSTIVKHKDTEPWDLMGRFCISNFSYHKPNDF